MKKEYDKRAKILDYKTGDKVLLDVKLIPVGRNKKLTPRYEGPYRILDMHGNETATIINENHKEKKVHINRLKPLHETMLWMDETIETNEEKDQEQEEEEEQTTIEEEETPLVADESTLIQPESTTNRRDLTEEGDQWDQEENPSTNDRAEMEGRPRLRDRRSIKQPAKLDL